MHFSGGERARLALAILVAERPNLLLLDEPTNHLDFEMRHSLITALQDFAGAVIVVSHDRGLLRSVCDQFWLVADGAVADFDGDLEDYAGWLEKAPAGARRCERARGAPSRGARRARRQGPARPTPQECRRRKDLAPKRQEIKAIETSLDEAGTGARQAREGARRDSISSATRRMRARSRERHARCRAKSSNWRHDGSNYPSG